MSDDCLPGQILVDITSDIRTSTIIQTAFPAQRKGINPKAVDARSPIRPHILRNATLHR